MTRGRILTMDYLFCFQRLVVLLTWSWFYSIADNITGINVNRYENINLKCSIGVNLSKEELKWRHNEVSVYTGTQQVTLQNIAYLEEDYSLSIPNVSFSDEGRYTCFANTYNSESVIYLLKVNASRARNRQGNQNISSGGVSMNILDAGAPNANQSFKKTISPKDVRKELPKIPTEEEDSQNSGESEQNYYSTADEIPGKDPRIVTEKDISIIMNIKMGKIYKRWMGSVNLANEANKCVVLTTLTERVMKKKEVHWETFLRKSLELPASNYLAKIEAISIQSSKLYLITEHFSCEDLKSVLSRDTKEKGDYYCCSSLSLTEVIKHVAGVLEGMDILKTFGFLHPGFTTKDILLTKGGLVKLYDFCLAVDAPRIASLKKAQMHRVTLNEFPPEMLLLGEYTESSDVWSTAVVIWEIMAAGNPPFPKEQEIGFDKDATTPSTPWPDKYLQIKDKILFECWNHNATLRPSIHHLRGTFVAIFEKLITDSSYEIPLPTMYLPMRSPDTTQTSYTPIGAPDTTQTTYTSIEAPYTTQTTYSERIYHVGK